MTNCVFSTLRGWELGIQPADDTEFLRTRTWVRFKYVMWFPAGREKEVDPHLPPRVNFKKDVYKG